MYTFVSHTSGLLRRYFYIPEGLNYVEDTWYLKILWTLATLAFLFTIVKEEEFTVLEGGDWGCLGGWSFKDKSWHYALGFGDLSLMIKFLRHTSKYRFRPFWINHPPHHPHLISFHVSPHLRLQIRWRLEASYRVHPYFATIFPNVGAFCLYAVLDSYFRKDLVGMSNLWMCTYLQGLILSARFISSFSL